MFIMMNAARLGVGMQGLSQAEVAYQNAVAYALDRRQGRALTGPAEPEAQADPIFVHPDDAAKEGIEDGEQVKVWNERGEISLVARLSRRVQPGLLVSYMVRWGANANATTPDNPADYGGNSTFHSNFVSVSRQT